MPPFLPVWEAQPPIQTSPHIQWVSLTIGKSRLLPSTATGWEQQISTIAALYATLPFQSSDKSKKGKGEGQECVLGTKAQHTHAINKVSHV